MATWKLSPQYKKSAVEKMFFYKDGKVVTVEQGFRWATFSVESDERPLTDDELKNEDGYELSCIANDESWEMWDMTDGCWLDIEAGNDKTTSTDVEEFEKAWEEDSYSGVEELGWDNSDTEYYYYGPLELTNETTGEVFQGEPEENVSVSGVPVQTEAELIKELGTLLDSMPEEVLEVTDWFPSSINPTRKGNYEVITAKAPNWPFPSTANWDGKKWNEEIVEWRGLANDPEAV
jgi:hypothetical protein